MKRTANIIIIVFDKSKQSNIKKIYISREIDFNQALPSATKYQPHIIFSFFSPSLLFYIFKLYDCKQ